MATRPRSPFGGLQFRESELLGCGPVRNFQWLLHDELEDDHVAEDDRKEVDRQARDVDGGAVRETG